MGGFGAAAKVFAQAMEVGAKVARTAITVGKGVGKAVEGTLKNAQRLSEGVRDTAARARARNPTRDIAGRHDRMNGNNKLFNQERVKAGPVGTAVEVEIDRPRGGGRTRPGRGRKSGTDAHTRVKKDDVSRDNTSAWPATNQPAEVRKGRSASRGDQQPPTQGGHADAATLPERPPSSKDATTRNSRPVDATYVVERGRPRQPVFVSAATSETALKPGDTAFVAYNPGDSPYPQTHLSVEPPPPPGIDLTSPRTQPLPLSESGIPYNTGEVGQAPPPPPLDGLPQPRSSIPTEEQYHPIEVLPQQTGTIPGETTPRQQLVSSHDNGNARPAPPVEAAQPPAALENATGNSGRGHLATFTPEQSSAYRALSPERQQLVNMLPPEQQQALLNRPSAGRDNVLRGLEKLEKHNPTELKSYLEHLKQLSPEMRAEWYRRLSDMRVTPERGIAELRQEMLQAAPLSTTVSVETPGPAPTTADRRAQYLDTYNALTLDQKQAINGLRPEQRFQLFGMQDKGAMNAILNRLATHDPLLQQMFLEHMNRLPAEQRANWFQQLTQAQPEQLRDLMQQMRTQAPLPPVDTGTPATKPRSIDTGAPGAKPESTDTGTQAAKLTPAELAQHIEALPAEQRDAFNKLNEAAQWQQQAQEWLLNLPEAQRREIFAVLTKYEPAIQKSFVEGIASTSAEQQKKIFEQLGNFRNLTTEQQAQVVERLTKNMQAGNEGNALEQFVKDLEAQLAISPSPNLESADAQVKRGRHNPNKPLTDKQRLSDIEDEIQKIVKRGNELNEKAKNGQLTPDEVKESNDLRQRYDAAIRQREVLKKKIADDVSNRKKQIWMILLLSADVGLVLFGLGRPTDNMA